MPLGWSCRKYVLLKGINFRADSMQLEMSNYLPLEEF